MKLIIQDSKISLKDVPDTVEKETPQHINRLNLAVQQYSQEQTILLPQNCSSAVTNEGNSRTTLIEQPPQQRTINWQINAQLDKTPTEQITWRTTIGEYHRFTVWMPWCYFILHTAPATTPFLRILFNNTPITQLKQLNCLKMPHLLNCHNSGVCSSIKDQHTRTPARHVTEFWNSTFNNDYLDSDYRKGIKPPHYLPTIAEWSKMTKDEVLQLPWRTNTLDNTSLFLPLYQQLTEQEITRTILNLNGKLFT